MWEYGAPNTMTHHGILGMKWGVRRFQNKDGTLTGAGRKRYDVELEKKKANVKNWRNSPAQERFYKKELRDLKTDISIANQKKKSKSQIKYEQEYLKKGFSTKEAERAAYNRVKTMKILGVIAGVTVASLAAYGIYKYRDNTVDKIVKANTLFQNLSTESTKGVEDAFYTAVHDSDKKKYLGLFGKQLSVNGSDVFKTTFKNVSDLKTASPKNAQLAIKELWNKDPEFKQNLVESLKELDGGGLRAKRARTINSRALRALENGKINTDVYEALNTSLVYHTPRHQEFVVNKFYKTMREKGYDAIRDVNDFKNSGYKAKNPLIVFNGSQKLVQDGVEHLSKEAIQKAFNQEINKFTTRSIAETGAKYSAVVLGFSGINSAKQKALHNSIVSKYRLDHPNSKLSYNEIIRNYENGH